MKKQEPSISRYHFLARCPPSLRLKIIYVLLLVLSIYAVTDYFNYASRVNTLPTFPLDDAWIFWGFSRTFAETGVISINANTPPGPGVTSPGYMLLLALLIKTNLFNEFTANLLLNVILLFFSLILIFNILHSQIKHIGIAFSLAVLFVLDWRTAVIANSGMEVMLFICIQLLVLYFLQKGKLNFVFLFIGLGIWVRPEILIFIPVVVLLYRKTMKIKNLLYFLFPFLTYFIFLKIFTGHFWLNTGAAKHDFYAYLSQWDFLKNSLVYFGKTAFPFIPLFFLGALVLVFQKRKENLLFIVLVFYLLFFWLGYIFYLPALYHFGRYVFPLVPLIIIFSILSFKYLMNKSQGKSIYKYAVYVILLVSVIWGAYGFQRGKETYAYECRAFLVRHMNLALWIKENLPGEVSVATHDIGALGYFSEKRIIDIIGLMDKKAIGISRDPKKINSFLAEEKCDYIAVLNSWFVVLNSKLLYETPRKGMIRFQLFKYTPETQIIRYDLYHESRGTKTQ